MNASEISSRHASKVVSLLCAAILIALTMQQAHAENPTKTLVPVKASVGEVVDTRSTGSFSSECKIELKFTGDAATDATTVREVNVKKAVDELDRDLTRADASDPFMRSSSSQHNGALKTDLRLRNPSRNATVIKLLEGEVELFSPSSANGGVLVIKDILKHPGEPVQNPALKKYGIELIYLTKETYEARKKQLEEQQNKASGAIDSAFGEMFKSMFGGMMGSDKQNSVKLYVKDPDKRVIDIEFQDATGKELKRGGSWSSGEMRSVDFNTPPPADTQLLVHIATPESLQKFAFSIQNIPLP